MHAALMAVGATAIAFSAGAVPAQTMAEAAAANLRGGATLCLREFRAPEAIPTAMEASGWTLSPGMDAGALEVSAPGVSGVVVPGEGYCMLQSAEIGLDATRAIGAELVAALFPGLWRKGAPEGGQLPCDGYTVFPGRGLIWMSFSGAGNSGECSDPGGAIILRM